MPLKPLTPDQEPDEVFVAQNTPLPENIIGLAGNTVRDPLLYIIFIEYFAAFTRSTATSTSPQFD
tara:strand:- start:772 stop:966 length:195 start_codon:yes stop_codon:yes gene_type:complete